MKTLLLLGLAAVTVYLLRPQRHRKLRREPRRFLEEQAPQATPQGAFHLGR